MKYFRVRIEKYSYCGIVYTSDYNFRTSDAAWAFYDEKSKEVYDRYVVEEPERIEIIFEDDKVKKEGKIDE